tara:strand:+ start:204 stop:536 length:333 start_codon:yes stop_codon:yes gene_type:complete
MKKLLLITFLFLITPDAKANMDYVCMVYYGKENLEGWIKQNCERNNILHLFSIPSRYILNVTSRWCRQDREINYLVQTDERLNSFEDEDELFKLSCVLYDNKPRKIITQR